jgi:hypothetical protein
MSKKAKQEYLEEIILRYQRADRTEKRKILDEFCEVCRYNRKYAIRKLNKIQTDIELKNKKPGKRPKYNKPEIREFLITTWKAANQPCSKRLKAVIPLWLPFYAELITPEVRKLILNISPATIDRIFNKFRGRYKKYGISTTKPGSIVREFVPIKTDQWDEKRPGFLEADTVAHCGTSVAGMFTYSLNMVDIATGWAFQRAVWGKGERGVLEAIRDIESKMPFPILGFDSDNGNEFLNWHLLKYFKQRNNPVQYTRSRAYKKNDNAHVEGKNWTLIRQYLGYERFDNQEIVHKLNDFYTHTFYYLVNFFLPSVKLINKQRIGSKIIKKHDSPKTPYQRVLESEHVSQNNKQKLTAIFKTLNPYKLEEEIREKIKGVYKLVSK